MRTYTKTIVFILLAATAIFTVACPKRVSIADIEANPSKYNDKEIAVAGTVLESYGANIPGTSIRGGIYKIDDGTGTLWIITDNAVPGKGSKIGVKGRMGSGINWNGRNYGLGMYEKDRRFAKK